MSRPPFVTSRPQANALRVLKIYHLPVFRNAHHDANAFHSIDHHWSDAQFATAFSDTVVDLRALRLRQHL